ncbi:Uma2 family endonuclease [Streptomyces scabiei]|uniref:Uma2 family endonuclease n=1 Tax=Streptomyces scabiei TaxID=1930 RepID=UPI0036E4FE77
MTALMHERPEAMPEIRTDPEPVSSLSELGEVVWQAWKAIELPEGYRAEIIERAIELSPTGRHSHSQTVNLFRDDLADHLRGGDLVARQDGNIIHEGRVWVPDLFVVPRDSERYVTADGLGIVASAVRLIVEVVSPCKVVDVTRRGTAPGARRIFGDPGPVDKPDTTWQDVATQLRAVAAWDWDVIFGDHQWNRAFASLDELEGWARRLGWTVSGVDTTQCVSVTTGEVSRCGCLRCSATPHA